MHGGLLDGAGGSGCKSLAMTGCSSDGGASVLPSEPHWRDGGRFLAHAKLQKSGNRSALHLALALSLYDRVCYVAL